MSFGLHSPPPKEQGKYERWSLVFFTRPGNTQILHPLVDESALIAEAAAKDTEGKLNTGATSAEWFARRIKNQRIKNRTVRVPSPVSFALAVRYRNNVLTRVCECIGTGDMARESRDGTSTYGLLSRRGSMYK